MRSILDFFEKTVEQYPEKVAFADGGSSTVLEYSGYFIKGLRMSKVETMRSILDFFEKTVEQYPEKVAFADEEKSCTYRELQMRSKRIASYLLDKVELGQPVPIFMEKGVDTIAVFLGSVYAGAFYTVLDIKHPKTRIESILNTLKSDFFFSSEAFRKEAEQYAEEKTIYWLEEAEQTEIDEEGLARMLE